MLDRVVLFDRIEPLDNAMTRERLPNRRAAETFEIEARGLRYSVSIGRFEDGRLAEVFITANKIGSDLAIVACDAAVLCSIALQCGASANVLRRALMRDPRGNAIGPLGIVLDRILATEEEGMGPYGH